MVTDPKLDDCPALAALAVIGGKWTTRILWLLRPGPMQFGALRRTQLHAAFRQGNRRGAYWRVGGHVKARQEGSVGYSEALATEVLAAIRTDLDGFSEAERAVLENHGYTLCAAALASYVPDLGHVVDAPAPRPPFPEWMDETRVRDALRGSGRRRLFGRRHRVPEPASPHALSPALRAEDPPPEP